MDIFLGEIGSKTSETMNQSGSSMSDSLTVTWPKESWNRDHISYCCCNIEVPEHWDLEGGSNGSDTLSLGSRRDIYIYSLCFLLSPPIHKTTNKSRTQNVCLLPFSPHTLPGL